MLIYYTCIGGTSMEERIRTYIELSLESSHKQNKEEIVEEIFSNTIERYNDLLIKGYDSMNAYNICISNLGNLKRTISNDFFDDSIRKHRMVMWIILSMLFLSVIALFLYSPGAYILFGIASLSWLLLLNSSFKGYKTYYLLGRTENAKRIISQVANYIFPICLVLIISSTCLVWDGVFRFLFDLKSTSSIDWISKIDPVWFPFLLFFIILAFETILIGYPTRQYLVNMKSQYKDLEILNVPKWFINSYLKKDNHNSCLSKKIIANLMQFWAFLLLLLLLVSKVRIYEFIPSTSFEGELVLIETELAWTYFFGSNLYIPIILIFMLYISYVVMSLFTILLRKRNSFKLWNIFSLVIIGILIITQFVLFWETEYRISILGAIILASISFLVSNLYVKYFYLLGELFNE